MRGDQRKAAQARWKKYPTRWDVQTTPPGELIGPVNADHRHGYVMIKSDGMGYELVHPARYKEMQNDSR
jgi:hypothetical protein